jgi:uncharacterized phage-associated protein
MKFVFDERKAAEAAAHLLRMAGGRMPYLSLIKLMYLADRRTLIETGFTITGDRMVSMPHGTVLSKVYDRAKATVRAVPTVWSKFVSFPEGEDKSVRLLQQPPAAGKLSKYEIRVLADIYRELGPLNQWQLRDLTHDLPEWRDPHGGSIEIDPSEILKLERKSEEEIAWRVELADSFLNIDKRRLRLKE